MPSENHFFLTDKMLSEPFPALNESFLKIRSGNQTEETLQKKRRILECLLNVSRAELNSILETIDFSIFYQTEKFVSPFSLAASKGDVQSIYTLIEYDIKREFTINKKVPLIKLADELTDSIEWFFSSEEKNIALANVIIGNETTSIIDYYKNKNQAIYIILLQKHLLARKAYVEKEIFFNAIVAALNNKNFSIAHFFLQTDLITEEQYCEVLTILITTAYNKELYKLVLKTVSENGRGNIYYKMCILKYLIANDRFEVFEYSCQVLKDILVLIPWLLQDALLYAINSSALKFIDSIINFMDSESASLPVDPNNLVINAAINTDNTDILVSVLGVVDLDFETCFNIAVNAGKNNIANYLRTIITEDLSSENEASCNDIYFNESTSFGP